MDQSTAMSVSQIVISSVAFLVSLFTFGCVRSTQKDVANAAKLSMAAALYDKLSEESRNRLHEQYGSDMIKVYNAIAADLDRYAY